MTTIHTEPAGRTLQDLAGELFDSFERKQREDGSQFVTSDDERVAGFMRDAHSYGQHLPCDWHYEQVRAALGGIAGGELSDEDGVTDWADSQVDVYTQARREWLANCGHYDDAEAAELMTGSDEAGNVNVLLGVAQFVELRQIANVVLDAVRELLEGEAE